MVLLIVLTLVFSLFVILYGLKNFSLDDNIRDFLKGVVSWFLIGVSVFLIFYLMGGGVG